jgi:hypothetical protein
VPSPSTTAETAALAFFEHPVVQFPIERDSDDFEAFVANRLGAYVDFVKTVNPADSMTADIKANANKIEELCHSLKEAIHEYLRGLPHVAYARLDRGIRLIAAELRRYVSKQVTHPFMNQLYRMRVESQPGASFTKGDLFHIPFQLRHKVTRQRYSIPGLPCLYLGGSLYICWEELRRPSFESIHVVRCSRFCGQSNCLFLT